MEFQHDGKRYLVSWMHFDDTAEAPQKDGTVRESVASVLHSLHSLPMSEQDRMGVPKKIARNINGKRVTYDGLSICRIRTPKPNADQLPPQDRWETVAEGYSFKRSDEPFFDKKAARRHSLARAVKGQFTHEARTRVWNQFNTIWPPVRPDATIWEKRYIKLQQEVVRMEQRVSELIKNIEQLQAETATERNVSN